MLFFNKKYNLIIVNHSAKCFKVAILDHETLKSIKNFIYLNFDEAHVLKRVKFSRRKPYASTKIKSMSKKFDVVNIVLKVLYPKSNGMSSKDMVSERKAICYKERLGIQLES